jgi:hypothetical protein
MILWSISAKLTVKDVMRKLSGSIPIHSDAGIVSKEKNPTCFKSGLKASMRVCGFPRRQGLPSQSAGY